MGRSQWSKGMLNTSAMVKRIEMVGTVVTVPEPPALEKNIYCIQNMSVYRMYLCLSHECRRNITDLN